MIIVPGRNPMGNVIHVVIGPASELFVDMNGAAIASIEDTLHQFDDDRPVFLSLTRTRSEAETVKQLRATGAVFQDTLKMRPKRVEGGPPEVQVPHGQSAEAPSLPAKAYALPGPDLRVGKCQLCAQQTGLLPIPDMDVCVYCAKIEVGKTLMGQAPKKSPPEDTEDAK